MRQQGEPKFRTLTSSFFRGRGRYAAAGWRRLNGEDGSNLVEYAIMLIVFLTMLFGIMGFGQALYTYHFASHAAREATRWAAVNGSTCATDNSCASPAQATDIQNHVTNLVPLGINPSKITATATWPVVADSPAICATTANAPGCTVQVQVSCNFSFVLPLIRTSPLTLQSTSQMVIAH